MANPPEEKPGDPNSQQLPPVPPRLLRQRGYYHRHAHFPVVDDNILLPAKPEPPSSKPVSRMR